MHTWTTRANNLGSFVSTVLFGICIATAISDLWFIPTSSVKANVQRLSSIVTHGSMDEATGMEFSLDADFRGVFSWNVKQIFLYVTVDYETPLNGVNEVSIWDKIITGKSEAVVRQKRLRPEYRLVDQGKFLKGTPYNLTVHWNVMPWVGRLTYDTHTAGPFQFPGKNAGAAN